MFHACFSKLCSQAVLGDFGPEIKLWQTPHIKPFQKLEFCTKNLHGCSACCTDWGAVHYKVVLVGKNSQIQFLSRLSPGSQWGAPTGHLHYIYFSPPATGHPGWRNGNARARCAGLRAPLGSCAAQVRRAAESAAAPVADHGRVRDGWCYEHQCHTAPSHGRLRHARQPQLRRGASSAVTRS